MYRRFSLWVIKTICCFLGGFVTTCDHSNPGPGFSIKETWDAHNTPALLDIPSLHYQELASARRGALNQKPWRDHYWPFYQKGIARRYESNQSFASFEEQMQDAVATPTNPYLSPAEKYDLIAGVPGFPLTAESWQLHTNMQEQYGDDWGLWGWMGLCSGWAPAAVNEPAPESSVLAIAPSGREVLFFEGDLRALLSKVYDHNRTDKGHRTLGMRCNQKLADLPRDRSGRIVDGRILEPPERFYIQQDLSSTMGALEVSPHPQGQDTYWLVAASSYWHPADSAKVFLYKNAEDLKADLAENSRGQRAFRAQVPVEVYKSCRDINPASFHMALVYFLSELAPEKAGLILETSPYAEVWNYPVWGFQAEISPPQPLSTNTKPENMPFWNPETAFTAQIKTDVIYIEVASWPYPTYPDPPSTTIDWNALDPQATHYSILQLDYTLEFDSDGWLIGGEWTYPQQKVPDFLWRSLGTMTDESARGGPSILSYSLLQRLLACSRQKPDQIINATSRQRGREVYPVVRCTL